MNIGPWLTVFVCSECGNVLPTSAFSDGRIYAPCQICGNLDWLTRSGRRKYIERIVIKKILWIIPIKVLERVFVGWDIKE